MSTHTAAREVGRRPLLPAEPGVLAAWIAVGLVAFALAWLAGWATAEERRDSPGVVALETEPVAARPPALELAAPLPALRREPVRRKPPRRQPAPARVATATPSAPPPAPPPAVRRPVQPPPPPPVIIVGKG